MTAHSEKPAHKVGKSAAINGTLKTACGLVGMRGDFNDELDVDGRTLRITRSWSDATCVYCKRRQVVGISEPMIELLYWYNGGRSSERAINATHSALIRRGLVVNGTISEDGRAYLAARKGKRHAANR